MSENMSHLWWRTLDHQVNFWDVQPASCHIGGHQNFERAVPEALQCGFSLFLRNVTVEGLGTLNTYRQKHMLRKIRAENTFLKRQVSILTKPH